MAASMAAAESLDTGGGIGAHCQEMFRSLARSDQRRASEAYVRGLLHCQGKKSIRRMARELSSGLSEQSLQQFVSQSGWDPGPVRQQLVNWASSRSPAAWVVDEVAFPKHGRHSAGVERQYVRASGRLSNCQLGVFVALATPTAALPVTWRLVLPRSWDEDTLRRRKALVPPDERHQPHWRYQVDALDDLCGDWGATLAPVLIDLRQSATIGETLSELQDRGLEYLAQVDRTLPVRSARPRPHADVRDGGFESSLEDLGRRLSALPRKTVSWQDPDSGREMRAHFTSAQVGSALPGAAGAPHLLLMEWGLGKRHPRSFWLTNITDRGLEDLVSLTRLTGQTSVDIARMTDHLGLCDYEGRSFLGWHHHMTLVSVAYAYHLDNSGPGALRFIAENPA
jgi:hypothetical protein